MQALTPNQQRILETLIHTWTSPNRFNPSAHSLPAVAQSLRLSLTDLLSELATPALTEAVAAARELIAVESAHHAQAARRIALDCLAAIAADDDNDPVERRRAATAVVRATAAPKRKPVNAPAEDATTNQHLNEHPFVPATTPPDDPSELVNHALSVLTHHVPDDALAALHACLAPGAALNGEPVPTDPDDFVEEIDDDARRALTDLDAAYVEPMPCGDDGARRIVTLQTSRGRTHTLAVTLAPLPTNAAVWRIRTITIDPPDNGFR